MKKFLVRVFLFSVLVLLAIWGIEMALYRVPNEYSYKRNKMMKDGNGIKTLILGHSQMYDGVNPEILGDSVFNAALNRQGPYYDARILDKYVRYMPNLECVIWPIRSFQHDLNSHPYPPLERNYRNMVAQMMNKYFEIKPDGGIPLIYWPEAVWCPWDGPLLLRFLNDRVKCDENGWNPIRADKVFSNFELDNGEPETPYESELGQKFIKDNLEDATFLAQICRDHGLRLVIVKMPGHYTLYTRVNPMDSVVNSECIQAIKDVYPDAEYYDFFKDARFETEDFCDNCHLNMRGADKFSKILRDTLFIEHEKLRQDHQSL